MSGGLIFFDITLLVLRTAYRTPTGVARVELAYALELLKRCPDRVRFIVALQRMVQTVPNRVVERYLEATQLAWRYQETEHGRQSLQEIIDFLGVDPSVFACPDASSDSKGHPQMLAAEVMARAFVETFKPGNLSRYSNTDERSVYIHVSGSNVPSGRIANWLARSPSISSIFMLHDIIPLTHQEYVRKSVPKRHEKYVRRLANIASVIVANSHSTAETLRAYLIDNKLKVPHIAVEHLGTSDAFNQRRPPTPGVPPYFVYVSTIEPRKNHGMLLQVWSRLVERFGADAPKLILLGRRGWENEELFALIERARASRQHVLDCSGLCDESVAAVIRNARATLMPSHVEGFGLPIAESLAVGTPVICSALSPFREFARDVPEYVDPLSGHGWTRSIMDYTRLDSPARLAQLERIRSWEPPNWSSHIDNVHRLIDMLTAKSNMREVPAPRIGQHVPAIITVPAK